MMRRSNRRRSFIDGWGLILYIIGIALIILREDSRIMGGIIALIGFIRIAYVYFPTFYMHFPYPRFDK